MITQQSSVESLSCSPAIYTAVPRGTIWQIKHVQGNASIYSGAYPCREEALQLAATLAAISGGRFCQ